MEQKILASDGECFFEMGECQIADVRLWNQHRPIHDHLFVIAKQKDRCAYIHYGLGSSKRKIFNGNSFGVAVCQFLKYNHDLYVILDRHDTHWKIPEHNVDFCDFHDRVIDYQKIETKLANRELQTSMLRWKQTYDVIWNENFQSWSISHHVRIFISKHDVDKLPEQTLKQTPVRLFTNPGKCSLQAWMADRPDDMLAKTWILVFACYKKTGNQEWKLQSQPDMDGLCLSNPPSCLELLPAKLDSKFAKNTKYPGDKWENTVAHIHAKNRPDLSITFLKKDWFQRNKYGLLPIHTAILFQNQSFIDAFLKSRFANDTSKLVYKFANADLMSLDDFRTTVENIMLEKKTHRMI